MIENDIRKLVNRDSATLEGLERDIWDGVAVRARTDRFSAIVLAGQAAVMIVALIGGLAVGNYTAATISASELGVFSTRAVLAPSTLLLGGKT